VSADPAGRIRELSALPIWVAPMAGGPSTAGLVAAAAQAGALGFLAGGYKTAGAVRAEMDAVRAAGPPVFGVNLFVPGTPAGDTAAVAAYVGSLRKDAERLGAEPGEPRWDDDGWADKIALLLGDPPPVISFTFGCPPPEVIAEFRGRGTLVGITVTSRDEADQAMGSGADCLIVQGREAGAHSGTFINFDPEDTRPGLLGLLAEVAGTASVPLVAAGGLADADGVATALAAGATAVTLGTAFLRCPESGAHPLHKAALADPRRTATAITRAFSGRPARALVNRFVLDHPDAPAAYADPERMSLYAGQGFRAAADLPAAEIIGRLAAGVPR